MVSVCSSSKSVAPLTNQHARASITNLHTLAPLPTHPGVNYQQYTRASITIQQVPLEPESWHKFIARIHKNSTRRDVVRDEDQILAIETDSGEKMDPYSLPTGGTEIPGFFRRLVGERARARGNSNNQGSQPRGQAESRVSGRISSR